MAASEVQWHHLDLAKAPGVFPNLAFIPSMQMLTQ